MIICIPGRDDDERGARWYDTVIGKRVPQPLTLTRWIKRLADRRRRRAKQAR